MDKSVFNCQTRELEVIELTTEEITQRETEIQASEEQKQIEEMAPNYEEQKQADFEIRAINLLIEMGLL